MFNKVISLSPMIPTEIQPLLEKYVMLMQTDLPELLSALYVHGSIALDDFQVGRSDVDFIAVLSRPCTKNGLAQLKHVHDQLAQTFPRMPLSGAYLQIDDLGKTESDIAPHPHYHDGILHAHGIHDINDVTWFLLKTRPVVVFGAEPQFAYMPDWTPIKTAMLDNLNSYWKQFLRNPARIVWLYSDYGVEWVVLGVVRLLYTLEENDITSKSGAGEWGLAHLPEKWHPIIHEALNLRRGEQSGYRSRLLRSLTAYRFTAYVIRTCNIKQVERDG